LHWEQLVTIPGANLVVNFWTNEDHQMLASNDNVTISRSGGQSFSAMVTSEYTDIQWFVNGNPVANHTRFITINARDFDPGTYRLGVVMTWGSVPFSSEIRFTVTN
jgi:membrane carboxypeptidase/penicillin-binding protein PbpC